MLNKAEGPCATGSLSPSHRDTEAFLPKGAKLRRRTAARRPRQHLALMLQLEKLLQPAA
jgi:hypothetical protein